MSFSSLPNTNTLVSSDYLTNLYAKLNTSNVTNNTNLTPADAGFVGFTGFRANQNSLQVVAPNGSTGFINLGQAQSLGVNVNGTVVPLINSNGVDFTGVQRFSVPSSGSSIPPVKTSALPGDQTATNNTQSQALSKNNPDSNPNRTLSSSFNDGIQQVQTYLTNHPGILLGGIAIVLVMVFKK